MSTDLPVPKTETCDDCPERAAPPPCVPTGCDDPADLQPSTRDLPCSDHCRQQLVFSICQGACSALKSRGQVDHHGGTLALPAFPQAPQTASLKGAGCCAHICCTHQHESFLCARHEKNNRDNRGTWGAHSGTAGLWAENLRAEAPS